MNNTNIRPAIAADCPQMMLLIQELAAFELAPEEVTVSLEEFVDAGFGSQPVWSAFVAENQGQLVGLSLFYIRYSTWKGRRLYLEDLIVTADMRGQGIGKLLFDQTLAYSRAQGYQGMVWQVLDWNKPAIEFYKKYQASFDPSWVNVSINS